MKCEDECGVEGVFCIDGVYCFGRDVVGVGDFFIVME